MEKVLNSQLFPDSMNDVLYWFMSPDEEPWSALERLAMIMSRFREPNNQEMLPNWALLSGLDAIDLDDHKGDVDILGKARVFGGKNLRTDPSVIIKGPVYLGKNVTLRANVVVSGPCYIGDDVKIGHNCRVKYSIIMDRSELVYGTHLARCVVGTGVRLDKGVQIADRPYPNTYEGESSSPLYRGAAIGNRCVLEAGVLLGSGVILMPETYMELGIKRRHVGVYRGRMTD